MDYDGFDAEYGRVLDAAGSLEPAQLAVEVERLRALAESVQPPEDQEAARLLMTSLDSALGTERPPISDELAEALRVHRQARTAQGTADERIEQLRAGIAEIGRIAATADAGEQGHILDLNESLSMLLESVQITASDR